MSGFFEKTNMMLSAANYALNFLNGFVLLPVQ